MKTEIRCKVELREDDTRQSPGRLTGTLLTYGERASDRAELFERARSTWTSCGRAAGSSSTGSTRGARPSCASCQSCGATR